MKLNAPVKQNKLKRIKWHPSEGEKCVYYIFYIFLKNKHLEYTKNSRN